MLRRRPSAGDQPYSACAAAGMLTRAARRVVARAIGLLQDDGLLLSSSVRLVLLIFALCWDDNGAASLSILFWAHDDSNSDWLQECIGEWFPGFLCGTGNHMACRTCAKLPPTVCPSPHPFGCPETCLCCPAAGLLMLLRWAASFLLPA